MLTFVTLKSPSSRFSDIPRFLFSLIATFVREYLGPSLKEWSPRFFGDGALNLELMAKRRSEFWILLKDDIGVIGRGRRHQVVTRSDVRVVNVAGGGHSEHGIEPGKPPKILQVVDEFSGTGIGGYYIRLPDSAFHAYGDLLPGLDSRGVVWIGNKIEYVASDTISAAFQYEIRLDEVVTVDIDGQPRAQGAIQLEQRFSSCLEAFTCQFPHRWNHSSSPVATAKSGLN